MLVPEAVQSKRARERCEWERRVCLEWTERVPTPLRLAAGADVRSCMLCSGRGDGCFEAGGRLVNIGLDDWVHVGCLWWSAGVTHEHTAVCTVLKDVRRVLARAKTSRCTACRSAGATVGCHVASCRANVHFPCALKHGFRFMADGRVLCAPHWEREQSLHARCGRAGSMKQQQQQKD